MHWFRADLHIHSVLSPCGDLDMSPVRIIQEAKNKNLDIIGITDHNSTIHSSLMIELGKKEGISVFPGVEVNTREEVHCLAFFENVENTNKFQEFLDQNLPKIKNNPERFGEQLIVNEKEEILGEVENLLIAGLTLSIEEIEKEIHRLNGIFIPAHVDRPMNGIYSQIGFLPDDLEIDAFEVSASVSLSALLERRPELRTAVLISNSDAHYPEQIGQVITEYYLNEPTFIEWKKALRKEEKRKIRMNK